MEEINLSDLFRYYLKKIHIIILMVLLVALIGYYYVKEIQVPMYHGTTTIILVQKSSGSASETQNELTVNEKLVSTYSELIKSRRILKQVIDGLKLKMEVDELASDITVTSASETSIIKVTVSNKNNKMASKIANKIADVFKDEVTKIYDLENVTIIDKAIVEDDAYNVNLVKQMLIFIAGGMVLSCGIVFVMFYFDGSVKSKKDVEEGLGLPVLGEIPVARRLTKNHNKEVMPVSIMVNDEEFNNIDKVSKSSKSTLEDDSKKKTKKTTTKKKSSSKKSTGKTSSRKESE